MPYLDRQIPLERHEKNCPNPKAKRLLIKDYDERGNQKLKKWGLWCPSCNVVILQEYKRNPTKKQIDKQLSMPKLPKIISEYPNGEIKSDYFRSAEIKLRTNKKSFMSENAIVTDKEKKWRGKVISLNSMYKSDERLCPRLRGKIHWDPKLVQRFLNVRPEFLIIRELLYWPPLDRHSNRRANKERGWIPNDNNFGYSKYDFDCYNIEACYWRYKLYGESPPPPESIDLNKLSPWEKLVIAEVQGRMAYMEAVIRKYHESKIQIHVIKDKDPLDRKVELKTDL